MSWNSGGARLKGYGAEEIVGQPFATFFTPEDQARELGHLIGFAVVTRDMTERELEKHRQLESERRFRHLVARFNQIEG